MPKEVLILLQFSPVLLTLGLILGSADHLQPRSSCGVTRARGDVTLAHGACHLSTLASAMEKNHGKTGRRLILVLPSATILQHQNGSKPSQKEAKRNPGSVGFPGGAPWSAPGAKQNTKRDLKKTK